MKLTDEELAEVAEAIAEADGDVDWAAVWVGDALNKALQARLKPFRELETKWAHDLSAQFYLAGLRAALREVP